MAKFSIYWFIWLYLRPLLTEELFCDHFNSNVWTLIAGAYSLGSFGISNVCSSNCLKITGSSALHTPSIDASNYKSIFVEFNLDTWEYASGIDTFYAQSSVYNGNWEEIKKIQFHSSAQNVVADFPSLADGSSDIRLRFVTSAGTTDDAYVDDVCIYGIKMTLTPTASPTTSEPTTNQPTTFFPTNIPTNSPSNNPTSLSPTTLSPTTIGPTKIPAFPPTVIPTTTPIATSNPTLSTASPSRIDVDKEHIDTTIMNGDGEEENSGLNKVKNESISEWIIVLICTLILIFLIVFVIIIKKRKKRNKLESNVNLTNSIQLSKTDNQSSEFKRVISLSDEGVLDGMTTDNGYNIDDDDMMIINGDHETEWNNMDNEFIEEGDDDIDIINNINVLTPKDEFIVTENEDILDEEDNDIVDNINVLTPKDEFIVTEK